MSERREAGIPPSSERLPDVEQSGPSGPTAPRAGEMVAFSRSTTLVRPSALCGARTDAVLAELGYESDRIDALRTAGVIL